MQTATNQCKQQQAESSGVDTRAFGSKAGNYDLKASQGTPYLHA